MLNYIVGDVTNCGKSVLMHIVNNRGGWGKGVVLAISKKWREPELAYRKGYKSLKMGDVQFVETGEVVVANMMAQDGYGGVAVRYDALRECLKKIRDFAIKNSLCVNAPMIGAGLGGGSWEQIEQIIKEELSGYVDVTIHRLAP